MSIIKDVETILKYSIDINERSLSWWLENNNLPKVVGIAYENILESDEYHDWVIPSKNITKGHNELKVFKEHGGYLPCSFDIIEEYILVDVFIVDKGYYDEIFTNAAS